MPENNEQESKLSVPQSEVLAAQLAIVQLGMIQIDWNYAKEVVKAMRSQASFQDAVSILKPERSLHHNDALYGQARFLELLCEAHDTLTEVDKQKALAAVEEANRKKVDNLFVN